MKLYGKLILERKIIREVFSIDNNEAKALNERLESCLIELCTKLDISVPLWMDKNTKEFIQYHKTFFSAEQFMDKVWFDKFEVIYSQDI